VHLQMMHIQRKDRFTTNMKQKENFWVSELADEDQQRPKRRTLYYESRYVTKRL